MTKTKRVLSRRTTPAVNRKSKNNLKFRLLWPRLQTLNQIKIGGQAALGFDLGESAQQGLAVAAGF